MKLHGSESRNTGNEINYTAGPTASRFHLDFQSFIRVILGPVGGGKTVACIMDLVAKSITQEAYRGIRRTRWGVVRATYPELKNTTLKTFQTWIPDEQCHVNMQPPFTGVFKEQLPDGSFVEAEFIFLALDQPDDVKKLKSIEFTGIFINEVRYCDETIFLTCKERVGRFPDKKPDEGFMGATWSGIIADTNAWATTHWLFDMFDKGQVPEGHKLYEQPPAIYWEKGEGKAEGRWLVNPDAENLRYLPAKYYERQLIGGKDDILRVELGLERGISRQGKPVFPQFTEKLHVSTKPLTARRGLPIILGFDWELHPACVVAQLLPGGQLLVLEAIHADDESFEEFVSSYVVPLLQKKYMGFKIQAVGDPSARRSGIDKRTPYMLLHDAGISCKPAYTNKFLARKEAVDWFLDRHKLLLDPALTVMREAFAGGYFYQELQGQAHKGMFKEEPVKSHPYSDVMDSLQYICHYVKHGGYGIVRPVEKKEQPKFRYA